MDMKAILDAIPALIAYVNSEQRAVFFNRAYIDWYNRPREELEGIHMRDFFRDKFSQVEPYINGALAGATQEYTRTVRLPDGTAKHLQATYVPHVVDGVVQGFFAVVADVTAIKETEAELRLYRTRLEELVEERTLQLDRSNRLLRMDQIVLSQIAKGAEFRQIMAALCKEVAALSGGGACAIFGVNLDRSALDFLAATNRVKGFARAIAPLPIGEGLDCCGRAAFHLTPVVAELGGPEAGDNHAALARKHGMQGCLATPILSPAGRAFGVLATYYKAIDATPLHDQGVVERAVKLAAIAFDRKQAQERLNYLATRDSLTGLPNRALFYELLHQTVVSSQRRESVFAVLFIDLDGFKGVNDMMGHDHGDALLKKCAHSLHLCGRKSDVVARLGGDEFAMILTDIKNPRLAGRIAARVLRHLSRPMLIGDREVEISCSIGISMYPADGANGELLLKNADMAMLAAKKSGKNAARFFDCERNPEQSETRILERDLPAAIGKGELTVYYQPLVETVTRKIRGIEALIRWRHPALGMVLPERFIPLAEDTGMIIPLGEWVLREASSRARAWQDLTAEPFRLSVNVSPIQLRDSGFLDSVIAILGATGLAPDLLELEVTETSLVRNDPVTLRTLNGLKRLGVNLSVDDFGTGYASLSYLKNFPIDVLKIDQSFVNALTVDVNAAAIVTALLALGRTLNIEVVAEGVERVGEEEFLVTHGCATWQGNLFSEPVPAEAVIKFLRARLAPERLTAK